MEFPPPPPPPADKKPVGCLKIAAIGCGAMLLMAIVIGGGCAYWISRHGGEMVAASEKTEREGVLASRGTDEQGCVALTEARMAHDGAMRSLMGAGIYMDGCLRSARPTPGFCDGVPPVTEFTASTGWLRARCQAKQLNPADNMRCQVTSQSVQRFCTTGHQKMSPDSALALLDSTEAMIARRKAR